MYTAYTISSIAAQWFRSLVRPTRGTGLLRTGREGFCASYQRLWYRIEIIALVICPIGLRMTACWPLLVNVATFSLLCITRSIEDFVGVRFFQREESHRRAIGCRGTPGERMPLRPSSVDVGIETMDAEIALSEVSFEVSSVVYLAEILLRACGEGHALRRALSPSSHSSLPG